MEEMEGYRWFGQDGGKVFVLCEYEGVVRGLYRDEGRVRFWSLGLGLGEKSGLNLKGEVGGVFGEEIWR